MRQFINGQSIDNIALRRLLGSAHAAPGVNLMQPWRFIRIVSSETRETLHHLVEEERIKTTQAMGQGEEEFMQFKV